MILDSIAKSVQAVLGESIATHDCDITAAYEDLTSTTFLAGSNDTTTNGTTPVTVVASPASSVQRRIKEITLFNRDNIPHTVTVNFIDSSTARIMWSGTLVAGAQLTYSNGEWGPAGTGPTGPPGPGAIGSLTFMFNANIDIPSGTEDQMTIPYNCNITSISLLADQVGSIQIDIWVVPFASYPPTSGNSITASTPPTISSADKSIDNTLTGWTTFVAAGSVVRAHVNSCTGIKRCELTLNLLKT